GGEARRNDRRREHSRRRHHLHRLAAAPARPDRRSAKRTHCGYSLRKEAIAMTSKIVRIMIVDDDQDLAESLGDLLQAHGYDVDLAKDGQDALEHQRAQDFDVTLMDVRMPVMNGVDSFLAIRKRKPQT